MTGCPICERTAEKVLERDALLFHVRCLRCGPYSLSIRAEVLLKNKWAREKPEDVQLARARASHVIRSRTSDEQPLRIIGLEEIFSQPLPDPPKQVTNLIGYLKAQAGDEHPRTIDIKDRNALLGVVGAADESALEKLMQWASQKGLVSLSPDGNLVNLKPEAWEDSKSPKIGLSAD